MSTASDDSWPTRHRSLIVTCVLVVAVLLAGVLAGKSQQHGGGGRPRVAFGARIQPPRGSGEYLEYTNAWTAAGGGQVITVYAGGQPGKRQNGVLVIRRVGPNTPAARKLTTLVVRGTGALTLLRPSAPATEEAASQATVRFVTANGTTGTLNLSNDKLTLSG